MTTDHFLMIQKTLTPVNGLSRMAEDHIRNDHTSLEAIQIVLSCTSEHTWKALGELERTVTENSFDNTRV